MQVSLPTVMTAIEISAFGAPDVLVPANRPVPRPGPGEVLIAVAAAGVNRPDLAQRMGRYPPPPGAPDIPGLEVAGIIVQVGADVAEWQVGDRVCALLAGGGYAEYAAAPAGQCLPMPANLSFVQAAALPETYFTVWLNVFQRAALQPGESLLVQGGASGIGTAAISIAGALGHRVFATAGSAAKCAACVELGAELAINYRTEDFVERVRQATHGAGVDVILDMVAGDYVGRELALLADDGRLALIAYQGGTQATIDVSQFRRRLSITGSTLRARPVAVKAAVASELRERVWPLLAAGRIAPVIFATYPLARAASAHAALEAGDHIGKIVLTVDSAAAE